MRGVAYATCIRPARADTCRTPPVVAQTPPFPGSSPGAGDAVTPGGAPTLTRMATIAEQGNGGGGGESLPAALPPRREPAGRDPGRWCVRTPPARSAGV